MPMEGGPPPPYGRVDGFGSGLPAAIPNEMEESSAVIQIIITALCGLVVGGVICFPLGIR